MDDEADTEEAATAPRDRAKQRARARRRVERRPRRERAPVDPTLAPKARRRRELTVRALVILACASAVAGIAIVGTRESLLGEILVIAGMLGLIAGIHTFGRLGPDEETSASS